jgi:DNA-binding transcriptional LysR family regulator
VRSQSGYRLTRTGEELLERAQEVEEAMAGLARWHNEAHGERVVRISAGHWTSYFLARNIRALWQPEDRFRIELVTADEKVDIGHRHADIGIRNARPTEQWLAGRLIGHVAYGTYSGRELIGGVKAGMFIGFTTDADVPSVRWLEAHHADRIGVRGNNAASVRELVAGGAGLTVLPCFIGDADKRLVRVAPIIDELTSEQWLVAHHDERHSPPVRRIADRIAQLMRENRDLMLGRRPQPNSFEG